MGYNIFIENMHLSFSLKAIAMDFQLLFVLLLFPCSMDSQYQEELKVNKITCPTWYHTNSAGKYECGVHLGNKVICKESCYYCLAVYELR